MIEAFARKSSLLSLSAGLLHTSMILFRFIDFTIILSFFTEKSTGFGSVGERAAIPSGSQV
jgi:hypothetical protein